MERSDVVFDSWGSRCAAWLYEPAGNDRAGKAPLVLMCHGWATIKEAGLDPFARAFAASGIGVLCFDYRHFGASEGEPRQLLNVRHQHEDIAAALTYARSAVPWADPDRVALWGSSFGGGHVLATAARDHRVAAVVAQVPAVDALANLPRFGVANNLKLAVAGIKDAVGMALGREPHMLPAVGPPGSAAVMTSPDAQPGYEALIPDGVAWRNETAARIALTVASYRPGRKAKDITCPLMFVIAQDDAVTPADLAHKYAATVPGAEVRTYPGGHFDVYVEPLFGRVVADQTEFLARHLLGAGGPAPARNGSEPQRAASSA